MTRFLISFDDGAMTFPEEDLPEVAEASLKVVRKARDAGVWVFGGGLQSQRASVVSTDVAPVLTAGFPTESAPSRSCPAWRG